MQKRGELQGEERGGELGAIPLKIWSLQSLAQSRLSQRSGLTQTVWIGLSALPCFVQSLAFAGVGNKPLLGRPRAALCPRGRQSSAAREGPRTAVESWAGASSCDRAKTQTHTPQACPNVILKVIIQGWNFNACP